MATPTTYVQFAAQHGLITDFDVQGHLHAGLMAAHMPASYHRRYKKKLMELQIARTEGYRRYHAAIEAGEIALPTQMSRTERLEMNAAGDPSKQSTQAAIRLLARVNEQVAA